MARVLDPTRQSLDPGIPEETPSLSLSSLICTCDVTYIFGNENSVALRLGRESFNHLAHLNGVKIHQTTGICSFQGTSVSITRSSCNLLFHTTSTPPVFIPYNCNCVLPRSSSLPDRSRNQNHNDENCSHDAAPFGVALDTGFGLCGSTLDDKPGLTSTSFLSSSYERDGYHVYHEHG